MRRSVTTLLLFLLACAPEAEQERRAKNVILFIGDAAGIPTLHAASIHGYDQPRKLFIHNMPHIALMETSSASGWVTDSAAGMTAIVTGRKTHNGVVSQSDKAVRRKKDGEPLKTILEYAEERGLSTGVVSNSSIVSATPAACYAHVNDRNKTGEIFSQALAPQFGDGVDVLIGPGREAILHDTRTLGLDLEQALAAAGLELHGSLGEIPVEARRAVVLLEDSAFDLGEATERAIGVLSHNPSGFFLMVESDLHTKRLVRGLEKTVAFDRVIRRTAESFSDDETLIVFTADHSYDLRIHDGGRDEPLIHESERRAPFEETESVRLKNVRRDADHTAEEVLVAAQGPGAERVRGVIANTDLFQVMMDAYCWETTP